MSFIKLSKAASFSSHRKIIEILSQTADFVTASQQSPDITSALAHSLIETAQKANALNREGRSETADKVIYFANRALNCAQRFVISPFKQCTDLLNPQTWKALWDFNIFLNQYIFESKAAGVCHVISIELQTVDKVLSYAFSISQEFRDAIHQFSDSLQNYADRTDAKHTAIKKALVSSLIKGLQNASAEDVAEFIGGFVNPFFYCGAALRCCKIAGLVSKSIEFAHIFSAAAGRLNQVEAVALILEDCGMAANQIEHYREIASAVAQETVIATGQSERVALAFAKQEAKILNNTSTLRAKALQQITANENNQQRLLEISKRCCCEQSQFFKNGFCEVGGFKFSEYYYKRLWGKGREAPSLIAKEILNGATHIIPDKKLKGFFRYENVGWEMVYNPTTKEVYHLAPIIR